MILTLKELKNMVMEADPKAKIPSAKGLLRSDIPIVVREVLNEQTVITVYRNGYVLYQFEGFATVFPLHQCRKYAYDFCVKDMPDIKEESFENEAWYIRLMLEGEDRITKNQEERVRLRRISYSAVAEDWDLLCREDEALDNILFCEMLKEMFSLLTENQRYVIERHIFDLVPQPEIAKELHVSKQAVSDMIQKALRHIRREYGIDISGKKQG